MEDTFIAVLVKRALQVAGWTLLLQGRLGG